MPFQLHLLGTFKLVVGGETVTSVRSRRVLALLAYLVCEPRPVPRTHLADLLWPDKTEQQGRTNLRWAISQLRQLLPDALVTTRQTVEFICPAGSQIDLHQIRDKTFQVSETWKVFLLNLHPNLLDGFYFNESASYETWLITQREIWRQQVHRALDNAISHAPDPATALQLAQHQLSLDTWAEAQHRRVIDLLARQGQHEAALTQFETCQRILQEELGTEPTQETLALVQRIRQLSHSPRHNLPAQPTPFIGRTHAMADIAQHLAGSTRLVTIVGVGGMGKTRLALATAAQCTHLFLDGLAFVSFVGVNQPSFMATAIIQALVEADLIPPLAGNQPPAGHLTHHLRHKELLLILDNLEHLLDGTNLLADLLQAAPQLTILATSRERLNLRWEHPIELGGLAYPTSPTDPNWLDYPAIQLFQQAAQRARPGFSPAPHTRPGITQLCQLTDGMPLGLELSATWVRIQTPSAIAQAISHNLDLLASRQRDTPSRHRSIRATLDYSWALLSRSEQTVLAQLAVFRGDFTAEPAQAIAQANWPTLAALVDKSLLRQQVVSLPAGQSQIRYNLHEFIRQYASDHLGQQTHTTQTRHARHYATLLADLQPHLHTHQQQASRQTIGRNLDNIRQAWTWLVSQHASQPLSQMLYSFTFFYLEQGWFQQGHDDLTAALQTLPAPKPPFTLLRARLTLHLARFNFYLGHNDQAISQLQTTLPTFQQHNALWEQGMCWLGLGVVGSPTEQIDHYQRALRLFEAAGEAWYTARTQLNLSATVSNHLGQWAEASQLIESAIVTLRRLGDELDLARALLFLGGDKRRSGDFPTAQALLEESLDRHKQLDSSWGVGLALLGLVGVATWQGNFAQARRWQAEVRTVYERSGQLSGQLAAQASLVGLAYAEGSLAEAVEAAQPLLDLPEGLSLSDRFPAGYTHRTLAHIALAQNNPTAAHHHLTLAQTILASSPDHTARIHIGFASLHLAQNELTLAQTHLTQAEETAQAIQNIPIVVSAWLGQAALLLQKGQREQGIRLLEKVSGHPAGTHHSKTQAQALLKT